MSDNWWWTRRAAERKLRGNEKLAKLQLEDQIRRIKAEAEPAIRRAMAAQDTRAEDQLLAARFEQTSHLQRCILNLEDSQILREAHAERIHVAEDEIEAQYLPLFHLLTKEGRWRVRYAIQEKRAKRRNWLIVLFITILGVVVALVGLLHGWKR
jgi:hypothetical protein